MSVRSSKNLKNSISTTSTHRKTSKRNRRSGKLSCSSYSSKDETSLHGIAQWSASPNLIGLVVLSRPRGDVAPSCKPDIVVALGVFDDLLECVDGRYARTQVAMRDHIHHRGIFWPDFVAIIEFILELFEKFVTRSFFLHPVIIDGVLVRNHDQHL